MHRLNQRSYVICMFCLTVLLVSSSNHLWPFVSLAAIVATLARVVDAIKSGEAEKSAR